MGLCRGFSLAEVQGEARDDDRETLRSTMGQEETSPGGERTRLGNKTASGRSGLFDRRRRLWRLRSLRNRRLCTFLRLAECPECFFSFFPFFGECLRLFFLEASGGDAEDFFEERRRTLIRRRLFPVGSGSGDGAGERDLEGEGGFLWPSDSPTRRNRKGRAPPCVCNCTCGTGTGAGDGKAGAGAARAFGPKGSCTTGSAFTGGGCGTEGTHAGPNKGWGAGYALGILFLVAAAGRLRTGADEGLGSAFGARGSGGGEADLPGRLARGPLGSAITRGPGDLLGKGARPTTLALTAAFGLGIGTPRTCDACSKARLWLTGSRARALYAASVTPGGTRWNFGLGSAPDGVGVR